MARKQQRFAAPARDHDYRDPLAFVDGCGWLGKDLRGKRVLCLAAGGGKHGPLFASLQAVVTVVDISPAMLELDREVAAQKKFELRTVETSMEDLRMFAAGEFDIVFHPVSTCYVPEVGPVYRAVAQVLRPGGLYVSQHKQPASLQAGVKPSAQGYELVEPYYREGPLPPAEPSRVREQGMLEYLHTWEELLGEMCRAGFVIEDLVEPLHSRLDAEFGSFSHRSHYLPPYVRIKARRIERQGLKLRL